LWWRRGSIAPFPGRRGQVITQVIVGDDLPHCKTAILLVLSLLAFWDAYWPWFYSFISTLVSPLLYFLFNPSFLFLFPSLLFFLLLLALPISFPPWSLILPLCSSCSLWV
jgi:hypothetical protein